MKTTDPKEMKTIYQWEVNKVFNESIKRNKDEGTCVMGYNLKVYGRQIVPQPYQGNIGCYKVYQDVMNFLISEYGVSSEDMYITSGTMD